MSIMMSIETRLHPIYETTARTNNTIPLFCRPCHAILMLPIASMRAGKTQDLSVHALHYYRYL